MARHSGRLELTWTNKELALLSAAEGRYDYTWAQHTDFRVSEVRLLHEVDRHAADDRRPRGSALPEPQDDNLLITGDAMHMLRSLSELPEYAAKYENKIRLVYIDPPFNTGKSFNRYEDGIEHSIWLSMLRDRIRQILPLLAPNGTIWVHLDDVEVHRCRSVLDEEIGIDNYISTVVWRKVDSPNDNNSKITADHESILIYGATPAADRHWEPRFDAGLLEAYPGWDEGTERAYRDRLLKKNGKSSLRSDRPTMYFPIPGPDGVDVYPVHDDGRDARWSKAKPAVKAMLDADELIWKQRDDGVGGQKWVPYTREWAPEDPRRPWATIWSDLPTTRQAQSHLRKLGLTGFDTPKPEQLLRRIIEIATDPGDIVLDCFAGSGTTAAVAHKLGRRWVTGELREDVAETFTKPRLLHVINGTDPGGITESVERVAVTELPDKVSATDAQSFTSVLNRFAAEVDIPAKVLRELRKAARTKDLKSKHWYGGGGFRHLRVGPSMFEEVAGIVVVAPWATDAALSEAVCAQIGVRFTPDGAFVGRRGRTRVAIMDAMVNSAVVAGLLDQAPGSQPIEIWATQISPEAAAELRHARPGSTLNQIPESILSVYRQKPPSKRGVKQ